MLMDSQRPRTNHIIFKMVVFAPTPAFMNFSSKSLCGTSLRSSG